MIDTLRLTAEQAIALVNDPTVVIAGKSYQPARVSGEVSLKIGVFFDL